MVKNDASTASPGPAAAPWSIQERTAEIGGSVSIAAEGGSTVLRVTVPMAADGE